MEQDSSTSDVPEPGEPQAVGMVVGGSDAQPLNREMACRLRKAVFFLGVCKGLCSALKAIAGVTIGITTFGFIIATQLGSGQLDPHFWVPLINHPPRF